MKKPQRDNILIFFFLLICIIYAVTLYNLYHSSLNDLMHQSKNIFEDAIDIDRDRRLAETGEIVHYKYLPQDTSQYIVYQKSNQPPKYREKTDSLRQLSPKVKLNNAIQGFLYHDNPIKINVIDSLFKAELSNKKIKGETVLIYFVDSGAKQHYSSLDTRLCNEAYKLDSIPLGFFDEIAIQAYIKISPCSIVRKSFLPISRITFVCFVLSGTILSLIRIRRKKKPLGFKFTIQYRK